MKKHLLLILLFACPFEIVVAQNCSQILRQARTVYDEGRVQELPSLLESCINNGFTDEERTEAYRLLVLSYLYLDEPLKADDAMLALLRDNPQFQINYEADPAELISLYQTFRTNPIFSYGFKGGGNITMVEVLNTYGIHQLANTDGKYEIKPGYQVGLSIEKILKPKLTASLEIYLSGNYNTYVNKFNGVDSVNRFLESQTIKLNQTFLYVPVTVQFSPFYDPEKKSNINPYVFGGLGITYLLNSSFSGETNTSSESYEGPTVDLINQRNKMNYNAVIGLGTKVKAGKNTFVGEIRFNYGLLNQVKGSERYKNQALIYDYGYLDNDVKLHSISMTLGYMFPFYKPKKLINNP